MVEDRAQGICKNIVQSGRRGVNGDKSRLGDEKNSDEGVLASSAVKALCIFLMLKLEFVAPKGVLRAKQIDATTEKYILHPFIVRDDCSISLFQIEKKMTWGVSPS